MYDLCPNFFSPPKEVSMTTDIHIYRSCFHQLFQWHITGTNTCYYMACEDLLPKARTSMVPSSQVYRKSEHAVGSSDVEHVITSPPPVDRSRYWSKQSSVTNDVLHPKAKPRSGPRKYRLFLIRTMNFYNDCGY